MNGLGFEILIKEASKEKIQLKTEIFVHKYILGKFPPLNEIYDPDQNFPFSPILWY